MKKPLLKLSFLIPLLLFMVCGCEKDNDEPINDDEQIKSAEGYIVGFDPCTINHHYRIGYVIISTDLKDTLITYNLSDSIYKMPTSVMCNLSDTLYQIPESYFENYRGSAYFPESAQYEFKIYITYRFAEEEEKPFLLCTDDINQNDFWRQFLNNQVIILSVSKHESLN